MAEYEDILSIRLDRDELQNLLERHTVDYIDIAENRGLQLGLSHDAVQWLEDNYEVE